MDCLWSNMLSHVRLVCIAGFSFGAVFRASMEMPRRLPITDPVRVKARENKLWIREVSYAIQEQL